MNNFNCDNLLMSKRTFLYYNNTNKYTQISSSKSDMPKYNSIFNNCLNYSNDFSGGWCSGGNGFGDGWGR